MDSVRTDAVAVAQSEIGDEQLAGAPDFGRALQFRAQRLRYGGAGVDEVDVHAPCPVMARRLNLAYMAVAVLAAAGPADAPRVQLANAGRCFLAQQSRQGRLAQPPARF